MVKNDVTRRTVMYVEGARGLPMPQLGVRGPPREIFCKHKLWEGHFRANLKATGKKKAKKGFLQKFGKKGFCHQKKVKKGLKGFPGGPVIWYDQQVINTKHINYLLLEHLWLSFLSNLAIWVCIWIAGIIMDNRTIKLKFHYSKIAIPVSGNNMIIQYNSIYTTVSSQQHRGV